MEKNFEISVCIENLTFTSWLFWMSCCGKSNRIDSAERIEVRVEPKTTKPKQKNTTTKSKHRRKGSGGSISISVDFGGHDSREHRVVHHHHYHHDQDHDHDHVTADPKEEGSKCAFFFFNFLCFVFFVSWFFLKKTNKPNVKNTEQRYFLQANNWKMRKII